MAALRLGHRRLDLDRVDALELEILQQGMRREPGTDADHRGGTRLGLEGERQGAGEHHGDLIGSARPIRIGDRAVGFSVGAQADRARVGDQMHGRRLAVRVKQDFGVARGLEVSVAEHACGHLVGVEVKRERHRQEQRRARHGRDRQRPRGQQHVAQEDEAEQRIDRGAKQQGGLQAEQRQTDV